MFCRLQIGNMRTKQLSLFLVLVISSSTIGKHVGEKESINQNEIGGVEGFFEGKALVRIFREDGESLDTSTVKDLKAPDKGWGLPSVDTVNGWMASAYKKLPKVQTVASYLPESLHPYLPSQQTVDSYMPSVDSIKRGVIVPLDYFKRKIFGGYTPQKLLTKEERERVVQAVSAKLLNKEGENVPNLMVELGEKMADRTGENLTPMMIRLIVHNVVWSMAVSYVGVGSYLVRAQVDALSDAVADRAIKQYMAAGPDRIDLYSYLKKIDWKGIFQNVAGIANQYLGVTKEQ